MKKLLALCFLLVAGPALAGSLTWNAPTTYTNGEPLTVQSYRVFENGVLLKTVSAPATATSIFRKPNSAYTVTALDAVGAESLPSSAATTGAFTPGRPTGCRWQQ